MTLVEIVDGEVTYRRRGAPFIAVQNVNLAIDVGERVGIVGRSGSGKTTIARMLLGLVQPSRGEVRFRGHPLNEGVRELRRSASLVYQDPNASLNSRMRVGAIIAEPLHRAATKDELATLMTSVGLDPALARRFPHQLSGGQRQRVAIARALIADPELLVADEPVSALDVLVRAQVLQVLHDEAQARNLAMMIISHDLPTVEKLCTRVVVVTEGRIVEEGPVDAVFHNPEHPYTRELLRSSLSL
ncbi:ABC transporter ATP-binding protein [uncultured Tessaracoccus sp.]|uniref:ABC transporter ATP-binding protein n=1 Tax=uncultured Tessaracoccus sp. TaxID=905023 RepID=UPI00262F0BC0|nr:ABC transporter ATP-binding protein [uncultured Tessaracoccus sp.]